MRATAHVSPILPAFTPKSMLNRLGRSPSETMVLICAEMSPLRSIAERPARGVAPETASAMRLAGVVNAVIVRVNAIKRIILAVSAGFRRFFPMPPHKSFSIITAINEPIMHIHRGAETGRLNARIMPVTAALKSPAVSGRFSSFPMPYSKPVQHATQAAIRRAALIPKTEIPAKAAGTSAIITSSIMPETVVGLFVWGDGVTVSFLVAFISSYLPFSLPALHGASAEREAFLRDRNMHSSHTPCRPLCRASEDFLHPHAWHILQSVRE